MTDFPKKLRKKLDERAAGDALRKLSFTAKLVDFTSNDYLGFAREPAIFSKTTTLLAEQNIIQNGATGSRLLSGQSPLVATLEKKVAEFHRAEAALVFNSGYDANIGFFSSVPQRGDIVFYDELIHASIRDGITMGTAKSYKFKHHDLNDLQEKLLRLNPLKSAESEIYVVTESVFSMDGDTPDLAKFVTVCTTYKCRLVIDEAHAVGLFGTQGAGLLQALQLQDAVFARIVTFGKALGCHGAAVLGSADLKTYLVNFARSFIYTTGLPPHALASVIAAYQYLATTAGAEQQQKLKENIAHFNRNLKKLQVAKHFIPSRSAIHCCIVPGNTRARKIARTLQNKGFDVRPILAPTVPPGKERLRFCLHSFNTEQEIAEVLKIVKENTTKATAINHEN